MVMTRFTYPLAGTALLLAMVIAGLIGGPAFPLDLSTDMWFIGWRAENVQLTKAAILLTQLGGSMVLVPLALIVAFVLWRWRGRREGLLFLGTVMSGRAMIEALIAGDSEPESKPKRHLHQVSEVVPIYKLSKALVRFDQGQTEAHVCLSSLAENAENGRCNGNADHDIDQRHHASFGVRITSNEYSRQG